MRGEGDGRERRQGGRMAPEPCLPDASPLLRGRGGVHHVLAEA